ncbi:MAG: lamin tail domain-containing protein, partial [Christensenellaceae bacterium]|nr:lamin tail domain-containing protein [Christensenellaceae bacterium]
MKKDMKFLKNRITVFACAAATLITCMGALSGCSKTLKNVPIVITEVVASNRYSLTAADGSSPDWVEIYNPMDAEADLSGYGLTDTPAEPYRFTFPEGTTLGAGEYMVIYCTGTEDLANVTACCVQGSRSL